MVPSHILRLDTLPLTSNGKLDRRALPAPGGTEISERVYVAPESEIEIVIAEIWQSVLHLQRVSVEDSFFDLGGHSLLATQLISRLRPAFEIDLPLRMIFEATTVRTQAEYIELKLIESIEAGTNAETPQRRMA
jgi:acyl carrier protein